MLVVHDERSAAGIGVLLTFDGQTLHYETKGLVGGGLHYDIPVHALVGYHAFVLSNARRTIATPQLLVAWNAPTGLRRERLAVDVNQVTFQRVLEALASVRPDANLTGLTPAEAQKRLGFIDPVKAGLLIGAIVFLLLGMLTCGLISAVMLLGIR